jgi:hypothetical protein
MPELSNGIKKTLKSRETIPLNNVGSPYCRLGALTDAIITQHASLTGIAQQLAEIYYIGQHHF